MIVDIWIASCHSCGHVSRGDTETDAMLSAGDHAAATGHVLAEVGRLQGVTLEGDGLETGITP